MKVINNYKICTALILFSFLFINSTYASSNASNYHCKGKYNTGAVYDHFYEMEKGMLGDSLILGGGEFKIQLNPLFIYAVYISNTKTEVIFIHKKTLKVEYISVFPYSVLIAKGQCKEV